VGSGGREPGEFISPIGIVFDGTGQMYVSDWILRKVQVFDCQGKYYRDVSWSFKKPTGLAFSPEGYLLVLDGDAVLCIQESVVWDNREVVATLLFTFGSTGSTEGLFLSPSGICVARDGSIVVADNGNCRVQRFDSKGLFQNSFVQVSYILRIALHPMLNPKLVIN
jgi:tripartite motif-containing protein 71